MYVPRSLYPHEEWQGRVNILVTDCQLASLSVAENSLEDLEEARSSLLLRWAAKLAALEIFVPHRI